MKLICVESRDTDPYRNLARETLLLDSLSGDEVIMYLWQNRRTVVIGRNQNAWRECRTEAIERDGGHVARRLSGGGAVYQDSGNLNVTFLAGETLYDVQKQLRVIIEAVGSAGLKAVPTGRNDIETDGRKFSGNAFYRSGSRFLHHGTIMVNVNTEALSSYLNVQADKLKSRGVASVRSRVGNLSEWLPDLTVERLKLLLIEAFGKVYGGHVTEEEDERIEAKCFQSRTEFFSSKDWIFGKNVPFEREYEARFPWGCAQARISVKGGRIEKAAFYSDTLKPDEFEWAAAAAAARLEGCEYHPLRMREALLRERETEQGAGIFTDLAELVCIE